jgi:pantetheine-phosphate adenylyltransferase
MPSSEGKRRQPLVAVYPGTFDPVTNGHLDIVTRAAALVDKVIVAVADNAKKTPLFSKEERQDMIRQCLADVDNVEVDSFSGLLVDYVKGCGARAIVRGLRAIADFEYEFQFAHMNRHLAPNVETMFLMTSEDAFYVSSSLVKEVASMGGDISRLVPEPVGRALRTKLA